MIESIRIIEADVFYARARALEGAAAKNQACSAEKAGNS